MSLFLYQTSLFITAPSPGSKKGQLNTGHTKAKIILVPKAVIRLASATDRELWLGLQQEFLKTRDFWLSVHPHNFEKITVTNGYKNANLLFSRLYPGPSQS